MGDALACLEFSSIARGMRTLDVLAKRAPVRLLHHGRHSGPKFIVLFEGDVACVEESYEEALAESRAGLLGQMFLPSVHDQIWELMDGTLFEANDDALLFVELKSVANAIAALDFSLKMVDARIVDAQFASGIDGRGYFAIQANLPDIEHVELELRTILDAVGISGLEVVSRPHRDLLGALGHSAVFSSQ